MPPRAQWKFAEDRLADFFNTRRRPLSGSNSRSGGTDDGEHPTLYLESKYSKYIPLFTLYKETREKARKEKKVPVIGLQQKSHPGILLCIHSHDFEALAIEYLLTHGYQIQFPPTSSSSES